MRSHGFTLLEISVVIVIIGLILGGVIIGRNVIANAEIQATVADVNRFKNAIKLFKDKYYYLPGDTPSATTYWGTDGVCPGGVSSSPWGVRVETCNGNGDGSIGGTVAGVFSSPTSLGANYQEALRAWQHLANAKLIEGAFSGVPYGASNYYSSGTNVPRGKTSSASGYALFYSSTVSAVNTTPDGASHPGAYPAAYGHIIEYGYVDATATTDGLTSPVVSPNRAHGLDLKIDDGAPGSGNVMSFSTDNAGNPNCSSSATAYLTTDTIGCSLIFITGF